MTQRTAAHLETWRDTTSYARRRHIFGPIRSLIREGRAIGEPGPIAGGVMLCVLALLGVIAIVAFSPSSSVDQPARAAEYGAGQGGEQ